MMYMIRKDMENINLDNCIILKNKALNMQNEYSQTFLYLPIAAKNKKLRRLKESINETTTTHR